MIIQAPANKRQLECKSLHCDLVVVGGGLAGVCAAVSAARAGLKVTLVQDRPVLGGNASSEVRLWILGATSHMGNNNRWAREGGVTDEILVENLHRNPEGNVLILDTILLETVVREPNITLLLNTAVHDLEKSDPDTIRMVRAFCAQNSTTYEIHAPLFCDASGDGVVGFLAGAAFRIGAEASAEFGERFAPAEANSELLGHTIYFNSKDTGRPVKFHPPSYALTDITQIPRWRDVKSSDTGCRLWWLEWGGTLDTIHDSETIKWELWKVAYGVWNHIKNSGQFPDAENLTLEWVGTIPGKRESRRFEGDLILTQQDIVEQRHHPDAVSFGGWAIDLHPVEGVYSPQSGCTQWHAKGVYEIPWRTLYSRNIRNLFLAGRIISASHVAFGSTRVMATCGHNAQAVGIAAAICHRDGLMPRDLLQPEKMQELQQSLLRAGQYIPFATLALPNDLAREASVSASSTLALAKLPAGADSLALSESWAMMLPLQPGQTPKFSFEIDVANPTTLHAELRVSAKIQNHTPDLTLATREISLQPGSGQILELDFETTLDASRYGFVCLLQNDDVSVRLSDQRVTGVLALCQAGNKQVAKSNVQSPPPGIGIDTFEFWTPKRRPLGKNLAMAIDPPLPAFAPEAVTNGISRPVSATNAWAAELADPNPTLTLKWPKPVTFSRVEIDLDTDFDHPMESVLMGHPERDMPFCVPAVELIANGQIVGGFQNNHQTLRCIQLASPITTDKLEIRVTAPPSGAPAAIFAVRCFE